MKSVFGLLLIQGLLMDSALGVPHESARPAQVFFNGSAIEAEEFHTEESESLEALGQKVIAAIVSEHSLSVQNLKAHGMREKEFLYRKARTITAVKYLDIDVTPILPGYFRFAIIFSNGSEFFAETTPERIEGCKGRINRDGVVKVNIDGCIAKYLAEM